MQSTIVQINLIDITRTIHTWLFSHLSSGIALASELVLTAIAMIIFVVIMAIVMVYLERKIAAFMQMRLGPNRVGLFGTLQAVADVVKLLLKEIVTPKDADHFLFALAPFLVTTVSFLALAPISFAPGIQLWDINIGILYITAVTSIGVIGILMMFFFLELAIIPKFLLIGIWGSGRKEYSAMKLVLMLMGGSAMVFVGILLLYFSSGAVTGTPT